MISGKALISVIVTAYNVDKYIEQCINSILGQTIIDIIEIIIVNDGSTDNTQSICEDYIAKHKNIILINQANMGVSAARNAGIAVANGKYIAIIDGDDYIDSRMYEILYTRMLCTHASIVICNYTKVSEDGRIVYIDTTSRDEVADFREALAWINRPHGWTYVTVWNRLYRRELFSSLQFEPGKIHEDEIIVHQLYANCHTIASVSDALYYYRVNPKGITSRRTDIRHLDGFDAVVDRYWYYQQLGYHELLAGTLECTKQFLEHINYYIANDDYELARVNSVKKKFGEMVKNLGVKAGINNIIIAMFPKLYYSIRNLIKYFIKD